MGRRVIDTQPAEARNALTAIEATSRETLAGLRQMLGVLRRAEPGRPGSPGRPGPGHGLPEPAPPRRPRPARRYHGERPASASSCAGSARGAPLPADIDLSAFRIIQEAVTNVVRHAGTGHCRVTVDCRDSELGIEVTDDGRGAAPPAEEPGGGGGGFGIDGMRERACLLGGELTAGRGGRRFPGGGAAAGPRGGPLTARRALTRRCPRTARGR